MKARNKYIPYIRKVQPRDRAADFRTSMRIAVFETHKGYDYYVVVQRGVPNLVIIAGLSKRDIKDSLFAGWKRFVKAVKLKVKNEEDLK